MKIYKITFLFFILSISFSSKSFASFIEIINMTDCVNLFVVAEYRISRVKLQKRSTLLLFRGFDESKTQEVLDNLQSINYVPLFEEFIHDQIVKIPFELEKGETTCGFGHIDVYDLDKIKIISRSCLGDCDDIKILEINCYGYVEDVYSVIWNDETGIEFQ